MIGLEDFVRYSNEKEYIKGELVKEQADCILKMLVDNKSKGMMICMLFSPSVYLSEYMRKLINSINLNIIERAKNVDNVIVITNDSVDKLYDLETKKYNYRLDKRGHMPYENVYYLGLAVEVYRVIHSILTDRYKVIVVDCDNTLWKGVCGEWRNS